MGVPAAIECAVESGEGEGNVSGATGETTEVTFLEVKTLCKPAATAENLKGESVANACSKVESVAAVNLPWGSKIEGVFNHRRQRKQLLDLSHAETKRARGYLFECVVGGLKVDDVCETASESTTALALALNLPEEEEKLLLVSVFALKTPLNANAAARGVAWEARKTA